MIGDTERYLVYSAVVTKLTRVELGEPSGVVIVKTTFPLVVECFPKEKETVYRDAFQDLLRENAESKVLRANFKLLKRYSLIDEGTIDGFASPDTKLFDWDSFYAKYPFARGIVRFSAVGLDPSGTTAMVRGRIACGPLCGATQDFVLRKRGKRWHVISAQACGGAS
jgi:hypothetical protein